MVRRGSNAQMDNCWNYAALNAERLGQSSWELQGDDVFEGNGYNGGSCKPKKNKNKNKNKNKSKSKSPNGKKNKGGKRS
jgi:hypothetical protein